MRVRANRLPGTGYEHGAEDPALSCATATTPTATVSPYWDSTAERLSYLFREFTRTERGEPGSGHHGSGVGLAICRGPTARMDSLQGIRHEAEDYPVKPSPHGSE